jgi:Na+/proline symporter
MVTLAACTIANILFGLAPWQTIVICGVLNVAFAAHSGLWGVLVIDMIQFVIGHVSAFPAMLKFLPVGFVGLRIGGLLAANSSTILTHLNWGSSYLVHDFYRRFIKKDGTESHYVDAGRLSTIGLCIFAALLGRTMSSAPQAFQVLLSIGAGTGLLYIARWFWWRVSAWCEIVAMVMSLVTSLAVPYLMPGADFATTTIVRVGIPTVAWLNTAFVQTVKPVGPGWISGGVVIWSSLFAIGNFLYASGDPSRLKTAWILTAVLAVSGCVLLRVTQQLWTDSTASQAQDDARPDAAPTEKLNRNL